MATDMYPQHQDNDTLDSNCELSRIAPVQRCDYIINNTRCSDQDALIDYLNVAYCHMGTVLPLAYTLGVIWLIVMFYMLGMLAEKFFCPALEVIAKSLNMSQNVAGVTLVAFGNASPDIFASIAGARQARPNLVFGALFGGGIFVTCCVAGIIMLSTPFQIMQRPFLRDVFMYMFSVFWAFCIFYSGRITLTFTVGLIVLYIVYLIVVLGSHKFYEKWVKRPTASPVISTFYDFETDTIQSSVFLTSTQLRQLQKEMNESTPLLQRTPPPRAPDTGIQPPKPFWKAVTPINPIKWMNAPWYKKIYDVCKAPILLVLRLTVPSVRHSKHNSNWCRPLNALHCVTGPLLVTFCVIHGGVISDNNICLVTSSVAVIGCIVAAVVLYTTINEEQPRYHNCFAYLAFLVGVTWIYILATEIVTVLKAAGEILDVGDTILGMTVLAWGNGVTDAVTTVTLAYKLKYPRMALAACFGGPVMNLLLGIGIPFTIVAANTGQSILTEFNNEDIILTSFLLVSLASSALVLPFILRFTTNRLYGLYLLTLYGLFLMVTGISQVHGLLPRLRL